jgi:hypothetical protein
MRVYKYEVKIDGGVYVVAMPKRARLLEVGIDPHDNRKCAVWALVDTEEEETEYRHIVVVPTGFMEIPEHVVYLNSFRPAPNLIFHAFERLKHV